MIVRPAGDADLPAIVGHGRRFFEALPYRDLLAFDAVSFELAMHSVMRSDLLLVAERGGRVIGSGAMVLVPAFHNAAEIIGQELYWFVLPGERDGAGQALLTALVAAAEARGAHLIFLAATTGMRDAALARLYRSRGYVETHRAFLKRVTPCR